MPTLDWDCTTVDGITLVELSVESEHACSIRIESALSPVWPPRRQGVPVAGWDGTQFETAIEADERVVIGYASPAEPTEPPAEVTTVPETASEIDPRAVVRALGDGTPPRDAVPTGSSKSGPNPERTEGASAQITGSGKHERSTDSVEPGTGPPPIQPADCPDQNDDNRSTAEIESYFGEVEQRLAAAEALSTAETLDQARQAIQAAGGIDRVSELRRQLDADRKRLDQVGKRQQALTCRLDEVEVPVGALERIA